MFRIKYFKKEISFIILLFLLFFIWVAANFTKEMVFSVALLNILPIMISALRFGPVGGLSYGIVSAIVLGPILAIYEQSFSTASWTINLLFFGVYGYTLGLFISFIQKHANYDVLTNLPNRKFFLDYVTKRLQKGIKKSPFVIVLINIDDFKLINESIGHASGDQFLLEMKNRIIKIISRNNVLARWSGDEFAIILHPRKDADIADICNKLIKEIQTPFHYTSHTFLPKASIGVSSMSICKTNFLHLVQEAEDAMRYVKKNGKNSWAVYTGELQQVIIQKKQLEQELTQALVDEQFELYYQPKVKAKTREIYGVEALIRWNDPSKGFISPEKFIPLAEENGFIVPLGEWVVKTACKQLKKWQDMQIDIYLSLNISAKQIQADNFVEMVADIIKKTKVDPRFLELEITESTIMENTRENTDKLNELKAIGVQISLDDFGKGYTSLTYLKNLPIDIVKIDRAFIKNIESDRREKIICEAIIKMSDALGLKVIAEGVENDQQLKLLNKLGCDLMQGFYFSKPLCKTEIENLLKADNKSLIL